MRRYSILHVAILSLTILWMIVSQIPASSQEIQYITYLPLIQNNVDVSWRWNEPVDIALDPSPWHDPISIIDQDGRFHVFWDTLSTPRLIYHTYLSPEGWADIKPIAQTVGTSYLLYPPVISEDGKIHFVWRNYLGYGIENPYRLMYASFDTENWSAEEEIVRTASEMQAMVQVINSTAIHVTYAETNLFAPALFNITRTNGGWVNNIEIDPSHSVSLIWPDRYGGVHLYQNDYYAKNLHYSYWFDGSFSIDNIVINADLLGHETQLDGQKNLHIFWTGQVPVVGDQITGVYYQCLSHDFNLSIEKILSGEVEITGSVVKASDNLFRVALGWNEAGSNQIQISIHNGCNSHKVKIIPPPLESDWDLKALAISSLPNRLCIFSRTSYTVNYTAVCGDVIE